MPIRVTPRAMRPRVLEMMAAPTPRCSARRSISQQPQLVAGLRRRFELRHVGMPVVAVEAEPRTGQAEALAQELGIGAVAAHAAAPVRIVELAAARPPDQRP